MCQPMLLLFVMKMLVSYKSQINRVIAHFLTSNLPNYTKNTISRQNIVYYILPNQYILLSLRQNITTKSYRL